MTSGVSAGETCASKYSPGLQLLRGRQIVPAPQVDTVLRQSSGTMLIAENTPPAAGAWASRSRISLQQLEPFRGQRLAQDGDPFHEELVEVRQ